MITLNDGSTSVQLRNPTMENVHSVYTQVVNRKTKGLQHKRYRNTSWPKYDSFSYIIEACTETEKNDYLTFVNGSYGKQITLTDYEGVNWSGVLTPGEITQTLRDCGFVISFEFEGNKV